MPFALDFDEQRHAPRNQFEQFVEGQDRRAADAMAQRLKLQFRDLGDRAATGDEARQRFIMEYDRQAVGGRSHIAFDAVAFGDRRFECGAGIFDDPALRVVQSAMRNGTQECRAVEHGLTDSDDRVDFNACVERKVRHADGGSRVASGVSQRGDEQVGCAVDHGGLLVKSRC